MPVTPDGRPLKVAPVAPVVEYEIFAIDALTHTVCTLFAEIRVIVLLGVTVIVPVAVIEPQPPVNVTV